MYHRLAHLSKVRIKKGDKVKRGDYIGNLGGSGGWVAHLHYDIMKYKPQRWTEYVIGKSKRWVEDHYLNPTSYTDKKIPTEFDHLGYGWLSFAVYPHNKMAWHSGLDINGKGAGNADWGNPVYSPVNGEVKYVYSGSGANSGWGRMIVIEEIKEKEDECNKTKKAIKKYIYDFGNIISEKEDKKIAERIKKQKKIIKELKEALKECKEDSYRNKLKQEERMKHIAETIRGYNEKIKKQKKEIEELKKIRDKQYKDLSLFRKLKEIIKMF